MTAGDTTTNFSTPVSPTAVLLPLIPGLVMPEPEKSNLMLRKDSFVGLVQEATGLSLRSLANFTGTAQSRLSRYGHGSRGLPADTLLLLNKFLQQAGAAGKFRQPTFTTAEIAAMKEQAAWCRAQCYPLEKKLAAVQQNFQQASKALHLITLHEKEETDFDVPQKRWLEQQRYNAQQKWEKNSLLKQKELAIKIAILQKEASLWEQEIT